MTQNKQKYGRTCTLIEFLTQIAGAIELAGELHENLSDRVDELIDPIRKDREWLRFAGKLDAVEVRAFEAVPKLRLMVLEAFERHIRPSTLIKRQPQATEPRLS